MATVLPDGVGLLGELISPELITACKMNCRNKKAAGNLPEQRSGFDKEEIEHHATNR